MSTKNVLIVISILSLVALLFFSVDHSILLKREPSRVSNHRLRSGKTPRQHQEEIEGRPPRTPPTHWPGQEYDQQRAAKQRVIEEIEKLLAKGALHSINLRAHQVRIEPLLWATLVIEEKKNIVAMLSAYFDAKMGDGWVTVLSNRNDTKLANYWPTSKLGVRIHR